jgi:hypothetical protein
MKPRPSNTKPVAIPTDGKFVPVHEDVLGSRGIATPFLTSALDEGEWTAVWPCRFAIGETGLGRHLRGG